MALPRDIVEQLNKLGREAKGQLIRDSRIFLQLGRIASEAHQLITEHGDKRDFARWCKQFQLSQPDAYKALNAWRRLGDAPGAEKQPRTVLELLGGSQAASDEARDLLVKRLTIREARAILTRHKPQRVATPKIAAHTQSFETPGGTVTVRYSGSPSDMLGAMLNVVRQLQTASVKPTAAPVAETPLQTSRSILDRLSGRAA